MTKKNLISLGGCCSVRWNLEKLYYQSSIETHLFDWLICDFDTVLKILSLQNERDLTLFLDPKNFSFENIYYLRNSWTKCAKVEHKETIMISIHDLKLKSAKNEYDKNFVLQPLLNKYRRRYYRLIQKIKSGAKIYFLCLQENIFHREEERWSKSKQFNWLTDDNCQTFFKILEEISPRNNHSLIGIYFDNNEVIINHDRVKLFNFEKMPKKPLESCYSKQDLENQNFWELKHYDWQQVFDWIDAEVE